jgi:hypothetical protein
MHRAFPPKSQKARLDGAPLFYFFWAGSINTNTADEMSLSYNLGIQRAFV